MQDDLSSLEICILAGGLSQRMGRDKARLRLGRKSMLGHIRATARAAGWPVRVIQRDLLPRCGPLGGIYTALKTTRRKAVLFLACDMPFVTAELLHWTASEFRSQPEPLFVSSEKTAGFPFVLPRRIFSVVAEQIERADLSLQALAKALQARTLRPPRNLAPQVQNVNTAQEWQKAKALWESNLTQGRNQ